MCYDYGHSLTHGEHTGHVYAPQRGDVGEVCVSACSGVQMTFQRLGKHYTSVIRLIYGTNTGVWWSENNR